MEFDANRSFPFAPSMFDAVIVSGLLEWLACSVTGPIKAVQREFMGRVVEILKLDRRLHLAIENRYWRRTSATGADLVGSPLGRGLSRVLLFDRRLRLLDEIAGLSRAFGLLC
jgi:hypothetical protein